MPDSAPVVRAFPGYNLSCRALPKNLAKYIRYFSENIPSYHAAQLRIDQPRDFVTYIPGSTPIYTAVIRNSSVVVNKTGTSSIRLNKEGNYSCVATNIYGTSKKRFSILFAGNFFFVKRRLFCPMNEQF